MKRNNKGFSLVELIIVIAIMAVLVATLAPQYVKFVEKSKETTDFQNIQTMKSAVNAYVAYKQIHTGTITITINPGNKIVIGGTVTVPVTLTSLSLAEFGIDDTGILCKSKAWKPASSTPPAGHVSGLVWTYDCPSYQWTDAWGEAEYIYTDGSEK